jgi:hypothetical protein
MLYRISYATFPKSVKRVTFLSVLSRIPFGVEDPFIYVIYIVGYVALTRCVEYRPPFFHLVKSRSILAGVGVYPFSDANGLVVTAIAIIRNIQCGAESSRRTLSESSRINIPGISSNKSIIVQVNDSNLCPPEIETGLCVLYSRFLDFDFRLFIGGKLNVILCFSKS